MEELLAHVGAELKKPEEEISDELVFLINSRIKPPKPVTGEQIFIRTMFLVSDEMNSYGGRFPLEELHRIAELVIDSPVMVGHAKEKLPIARNFKAEAVQRDGHNWLKVWFYWMKSAKDALSLKENVDHGIYKECSLGFVFELPECSICGQDMRRCRHVPFKSYPTGDGEREAYFNYRNVSRILETSLVYRGAVPNTSMSDELGLYRKSGQEKEHGDQDPSPDSQAGGTHEISPLEFVIPTKPYKSTSASNEIFHLEDLSSLSGEFLVEPKYDGARAQIHKSGNETRIFTDGGTPIEHKLPHLVQEILLNPGESFILDGELVKYKGNSRLPHRDVIAHLGPQAHNSLSEKNSPSDDSRFRFKLFDLLYLDGEDKTSLPLEERKKLLEDLFPEGEFIQMVSFEKVSAAGLPSQIKSMSTSEGAMIKQAGSGYFDGRDWYKWKRHFELDVLVTGVEKNKGGSFNYTCAVETEAGPVRIGSTYSTSIQARHGEIIRVRVDCVAGDGDRFIWHAPKVIDKRSDKKEPDSMSVLERMIERKPSADHSPQSAAKPQKAVDSGQWTVDRFTLQLHRRGKAEHHDLRLQNGGQALGLTIFELDLDELSRGRRFLCEWKDHQDLEGMDFEADIPPKEGGREGYRPKTLAAQMKILDRGKYEILERKADLVSLKIGGKVLKGVFLTRAVKLKGRDRWLFWKWSTV
ncbi:MAG: ATP-dependent DNA ligase [Candidatus Zixiibacteriota bacterium]|nr:MAG: ATP-dependent DNA ligase [candidate division Zixibacteria bacterium]